MEGRYVGRTDACSRAQALQSRSAMETRGMFGQQGMKARSHVAFCPPSQQAQTKRRARLPFSLALAAHPVL
jgi:hypothetical protein